MKILIGFLIVSVLTHHVNSAKILGVFAAPATSHYILAKTLMRALAEKGHDVTIISSFGEKNPPKNGTYRDIVVTESREKILEMMGAGGINMFDREGANPIISTIFMGHLMPRIMELTYENKKVQELINSNETFDVVIVEQFLNDADKALAKHFGAPLIVFSSVGTMQWINSPTGNPSPLSYIPDLMLGYSVPMTFSERLMNTINYIFNEVYTKLFLLPNQDTVIKKYIPNGPDMNDVYYNASLVLLNSHVSLSQPVPTVPAMVEIGGFHVQPPKKLPKDLQDFLDNSKDGVIYFSMGSNLKSAEFPPEKRDAFLKTFSKLKQNILWKWEDDVLPGQPKNVKLSKWLPQNDILAHPNVKLFMTHGGFLSTTETVYHGVPVLAIPIYGDQRQNAIMAVNNGYGLMLPYREISEERLTEVIDELLTNPKYRNSVKKGSEIFHDRLVSPMDTAIYWIEYVIRHRGAPHLRVAGLDLPWYKYLLLDVIAFLIAAVLTGLCVSYTLTKITFRKLCSKKKPKKVKTK